MNAIDTNVLLYYLDSNEVSKQKIANRLLKSLMEPTSSPTVLIWQVYVELCAGLRRWETRQQVTTEQRERYVKQLGKLFPLRFPASDLVESAFTSMKDHSLSFWDALLLAACSEAGVSTLYSEDLSHGITYNGVTVINPFL